MIFCVRYSNMADHCCKLASLEADFVLVISLHDTGTIIIHTQVATKLDSRLDQIEWCDDVP